MTEHKVDHNALLLQVMAHDLLAPLTAIKWQIELLNRDNVDSAKRLQYFHNLTQSTELGIMLTKHAHVAGRVLANAYTLDRSAHTLSDVVTKSVLALVLQYERHGVKLDVSCEHEPYERNLDRELVAVLVWAIAKFFLTCTPPQAAVSVRGMCMPAIEEGQQYAVLFTAPDIPEAEKYVETFQTQEAHGTYDQAFVFARLVHDVARLLEVDVSMGAEGTGIIVEVLFTGKAVAKQV